MLIVRADGNAKTGAGHLMRCLTIAEAVRDQNGEVRFFCADEDSAALVREKGFPAFVLGTDYRDPESEFAPDATGQNAWDRFLPKEDCTILADTYHATGNYLRRLQKYGAVFYMDDLQKETFPVDGVINYNAFADPAVYRKLYAESPGTRLILGAEYTPLRRQFLETDYTVRDTVKQVLITTGGGDLANIAGKLFEIINREDLQFHVPAGRFSPHFETWRTLADTRPNLHIHFDVQDMAALMSQCDIAVTAGGSTVYELAAVGVPFICFAYAENQEALVRYIDEKRIACSAGNYHQNPEQTLTLMKQHFQQLIEDPQKRHSCHNSERQLVDGHGAERLASLLISASAPHT